MDGSGEGVFLGEGLGSGEGARRGGDPSLGEGSSSGQCGEGSKPTMRWCGLT